MDDDANTAGPTPPSVVERVIGQRGGRTLTAVALAYQAYVERGELARLVTPTDDIRRPHDLFDQRAFLKACRRQQQRAGAKYDTIWALAEKLGMSLAPHTGILSNGTMSNMRPAFLAAYEL